MDENTAVRCCNIYSLPGVSVAPEVMFGRFHVVGIHIGSVSYTHLTLPTKLEV